MKALDYDPNKANNLIASYFDKDDQNQKFLFNSKKNELFNIRSRDSWIIQILNLSIAGMLPMGHQWLGHVNSSVK